MNTYPKPEANNNFEWTSTRSAVHEILHESRKRRVVIRKSSGKKVFECSVLLALILSVGAPILPAFVILGMVVDSIRVSLEKA